MLAVILGAFGAHGLEKLLVENGREHVWDTAVFYHLTHAVVLLVLAVAAGPEAHRGPRRCFLWGIVVFSGSLYLLAITNASWLGMVAPIGGTLLIGGWLWLGIEGARER